MPTYGGTFIHDNTLTRYATIRQYAGPQPIGVVYHATSDIVYYALAKTNEVRAYDTNTLKQIGTYNFEYTFDHPGNHAFTQGRLKISRDGSLLFATVGNGIRYVRLTGSPIAHNQNIVATEDIPQAIKLSGSEKEGIAATYAVLTQPTNGTLSGIVPNLTYTPATNYNGPDSFTFRINQNGIDSNIGTISIDVRAANDAPIAVSDQASTQKGTSVAINVLSNDSDIDKQPLTISSVTHPANGTISTYNGTITYTPNQTFSGKDSFTYTVSDGQGGTATASVVVTVIDPSAPPVADNQQASTDEDTPKAITLSGSTTSETNISYTVVAQPTHGTLSGTAPNLVYTPASNYNGTDSFTFKLVQGTNQSNIATVSLNIRSINDNPVAHNDQAATTTDSPVTVSVLGNDLDIDGHSLSVISVSRATHGITAVDKYGAIRYTPDMQYVGTDSFMYTVSDGNGGTATATVTINITKPSNRPVAYDQQSSTDEDTALTMTLNGSTISGGNVTYTILTQPAHGVLTSNGSTVIYTPATNYYGLDSFTFKMSQSSVDSNTGTISISVLPINDAPTAVSDSSTTSKGKSTLITVLKNDSDLENDAISVASITRAGHGTVTLNNDDSLLYTPHPEFVGTDTFSYIVSDGHGASSVSTVQITVVDSQPKNVVFIPMIGGQASR